jgi:hypothetical protein
MALLIKILIHVSFWILLIWAIYTGHWGWAILIFYGVLFVGMGIVKMVDPDAIPQEVKPLSDFSPVTVTVDIQRPADVVWPALLETYPGHPKLSIFRPWRREIHIGGRGSYLREKVILDRLDDSTSRVSHVIKPTTRWGDGSFGYTLRPQMYDRLKVVKYKVGDNSPIF